MTRLPPLETLRVFEVACRHGSYSEAARELHVTHSAVSQRIRQLEEELGLTLFERQGNRMVPTSSGLRLQAGVKGAFSELNAALGNIKTRRTEAEIAVSLLPVMAARWLVPRLPRFTGRSAHQSAHQDRPVAGQFQIRRRRHRDPVRHGRLEGPAGDQAAR